MRHYCFIFNPNAGQRNSQKLTLLQNWITKYAQNCGATTILKFTQYAGHATQLATEAANDGADVVVAIGGDGTINEVAKGLRFGRAALGIVPMGSGNGLARHLGISMDVKKAVEQVFSHRTITIDSGLINGHPFFCTAGVGFDAQVAAVFAQQKKRGFMTYIKTSFMEFWKYKSQFYLVDGQQFKGFALTFANANQFGNNAYIAPQANIQDGDLELCLLRDFPKWRGAEMSLRLFAKWLSTSKYMTYRPIETVIIEAEKPLLIHYDGESLQLTTTQLKVEVIPKSIKIVI
jgi:diacylglycerol kinase (ATP)